MADLKTTWKVTGQQETTEADERGVYGRGVRVSFRTGQGHNGSVFIPDARYRPDLVTQAIQTRAAALDMVGASSQG